MHSSFPLYMLTEHIHIEDNIWRDLLWTWEGNSMIILRFMLYRVFGQEANEAVKKSKYWVEHLLFSNHRNWGPFTKTALKIINKGSDPEPVLFPM